MQYVIGGTVAGALFAISGVALVLTYKTSRVFNFAQGGVAYFAAYLYYKFVVVWHVAPALALAIVVLGFGSGLGLFLWWALFRRLAHATPAVRLTATIGLEVAIVAVANLVFGTHQVLTTVGVVRGHAVVVRVLGVGVNGNQLFVLGAAALVAVAAPLVLHKTRIGVVLRGVVDSPEMSAGLGVNPQVVNAGVWVVGTVLVALAGVLLVPVLGLDSTNYETLIAASFAAAVVGRLSSLAATFAAGVAVGIAQSLLIPVLPTHGVLATGLRPSLPFVVIIVTLIVYSVAGLAPEEESERPFTSPLPRGPTTGEWDRYAGWVLAVAVIALLPFVISNFWLGVVAEAVTLAVVFLSWRVITGECGVVSLAQASLAGLGAAGAAKLAARGHVPVAIALLLGAVMAAVIGFALGALILRLGPLYAALATFAFGLFADSLLFQTDFLNKFSAGQAIGRPRLGPLHVNTNRPFFYLTLAVFVITAWVLRNLRRSTSGMVLSAVRSTPVRAATLGVRVSAARLWAFTLASFVAGLGGGLYASYQRNALPDNFAATIGLVWFAVVMLNGVASVGGALAAGIGAIVIPQLLTTYATPKWAEALPVLFGLGAIAVARNPAGAASHVRHAARHLAQRLEALSLGRAVAHHVGDQTAVPQAGPGFGYRAERQDTDDRDVIAAAGLRREADEADSGR